MSACPELAEWVLDIFCKWIVEYVLFNFYVKRGLLITLLALSALTVSASVRTMVPQDAEVTSIRYQVPSTVEGHETWNLPLGTLLQAAGISSSSVSSKARTPVAPYKRVEALLPIVRDPSIKEEHQRIANRVLRTIIPSRCIGDLKYFYVMYGPMKSRGYAGKDTVIVDGKLSDDEFTAILFHEAAHFLDLSGCVTGTPESGLSAFKDGTDKIYNDDPSVAFYSISFAAANIQKKGAVPADFVTGYAKTNCFEDMAESITYYVVHQDDFRTRAAKNRVLAKKLEWIETYVFPGGRAIAKQEGPEFTKIPWDATKLSYSWIANEVAAR